MGQTPTIVTAGHADSSARAPRSNANRRMLIDGQLIETEWTFASLNPATGEVLGHAPNATVEDAQAAIAAARRAFDTTNWATDVEFRVHCLEQLHAALVEHPDELGALTTAEVGATPALLAGPQLDDPILMLDDLDDEAIGTCAMMAAFTIATHAGQGCALTTRPLVPNSQKDGIVKQVAGNLAHGRHGDPGDPKTYMGPLISEQQRDKVHGMVQRVIADGATLVAGGEKLDPGFFYAPTLLTDVDPDSEIAQEEIYGLAGGVFGDADRALAMARRIRAGSLSINGGNYFGAESPFGGYKQSGIGREMGVAGLEEFQEHKTFVTVVTGAGA